MEYLKTTTFKNKEFGSVRMVDDNGRLLFCGADVAFALGYKNASKALGDHCKGVTKRYTLTAGGRQSLSFIPEGDVYRLIVHSRLPGAERFEKWMFEEVLPAIRKTGGYMASSLLEQAAADPNVLLRFAGELLAEHEKNERLSHEVSRLKPKAVTEKALVLCMGAFSVTAFAYGGGEDAEGTGNMAPYDPEPGAAETKNTDTGETSEAEDTGDESQAEGVGDTDTLTEEQISDLLYALAGIQAGVSVTEDGVEITSGEETKQTGTVTTNGGRLNVRTGAGLDNDAFTQLENGATVEVIGEDGDWIKVLLPERVGYVHSDYLTVIEGAASDRGSFSLSIGEDDISALLELFTSGGGGAALTPDGNLTLIDDIGSATAAYFLVVKPKQEKKVPSALDDLDLEEEEEYLNEDETEEME